MRATFNSRTITVKLDSVQALNPWADTWAFSESRTKLKTDGLQALIDSVNPLNKEYDLSEDDIIIILKKRAKFQVLLAETEELLSERRLRPRSRMTADELSRVKTQDNVDEMEVFAMQNQKWEG